MPAHLFLHHKSLSCVASAELPSIPALLCGSSPHHRLKPLKRRRHGACEGREGAPEAPLCPAGLSLQLVCILYVGVQLLLPGQDAGIDFAREYALEKGMSGAGDRV
jgi:hypothetical protein